MTRLASSLIFAGALIALGFAAVPAEAQATRTFVSGQGADSGTCGVSAPCRTFAYAVGQTASAGEVVALDSAGYGAVTITQSVTIVAPTGIAARISINSGVGVTVNGSGIDVVLDGIGIDVAGGATGILFQKGGSLSIDHLEINTNGAGIQHNAGNGILTMGNSVLRGFGGDSNNCFIAQSGSSSALAYATIVNSRAENCGFGFVAHANSVVTVAHSSAAGASATNSGICYADFVGFGNSSGSGNLALNDVVATNCYLGIGTEPLAYGGSATVTVANSLIYGNQRALFSGPGALQTFGSNQIYGNGSSTDSFSATLTLR